MPWKPPFNTEPPSVPQNQTDPTPRVANPFAPDRPVREIDEGGDIEVLRQASGEWNRTKIIDWPGAQHDPVVSPDGSRLAFVSSYDEVGNYVGDAIFVTFINGSGASQVTSSSEFIPSAPTFSPSGASIAFNGFAVGPNDGSEIYSVNLPSLAVSQWTTNTDWDGNPAWSTYGYIYYWNKASDGRNEYRAVASGGSVTTVAGPFYSNAPTISVSQSRDLSPIDASEAERLLRSFAPTLRYDSGEQFSAISVNAVSQIYNGTDPEDSNRLMDENDTMIATSNRR